MNYLNNKKALISFRVLGIVVLLLVVLSGTASADTKVEIHMDGTGKYPSGTVIANIYSDSKDINGKIILSVDGKDVMSVSVPAGTGDNGNTVVGQITSEYNNINAKLVDKNGDVITVSNTITPSTVPEFPSYAVPVIAMLGIFLILGYRKNEALRHSLWIR